VIGVKIGETVQGHSEAFNAEVLVKTLQFIFPDDGELILLKCVGVW
jgi:hypothetical protein